MYNLLIAMGLGLVVYGAIALALSPLAAILPAVLVFGVAYFLLSRRISSAVEKQMQGLVPLLQQRKIKQAEELLDGMKTRYGRWQFLLTGQIDAQLGMIQYLQMKWDKARPLLEKGKWRNWTVHTCLGCIHYRKKEYDQAWEAFEFAAAAAPKEAMIYVVWATLLTRQGKRDKAVKVLSDGLKAVGDSQLLSRLKSRIANKKKIRTSKFPETWYQFFPEDAAKQAMMRGRKGGPVGPQVPQPKLRGRMARRR